MIIEFYLNSSPIIRNGKGFHKIVKNNNENNIPRVGDFVSLPSHQSEDKLIVQLYKVNDVEWADSLNRIRIYLWDLS